MKPLAAGNPAEIGACLVDFAKHSALVFKLGGKCCGHVLQCGPLPPYAIVHIRALRNWSISQIKGAIKLKDWLLPLTRSFRFSS